MKVYIGSDHAGYKLKSYIINSLKEDGYDIEDKGTYSAESADYPDFAHPVADGVGKDRGSLGILICGSANGVAMTANKHPNVRCAIAWELEVALLARQHNDANVLALPARFIQEEDGLAMARAFLTEMFEGGRHQRRVDKIPCA